MENMYFVSQEQCNQFLSLYKANMDMLQSFMGSMPLNLESCTGFAQTSLPMEGDKAMSRLRMRVCIGHNDDGSAIIKHVSADSELALADRICKTLLESERRNEFIAAEEAKKNVPTFKDYTEYYLTTYKLPKIKPTTEAFYRQMNNHFYQEWENTPVDQITTEGVQNFLNKRKELSKKYLKEMRCYLKAILKSAMLDGHINSNPADDGRITNPSSKKTTREALSVADVRDILANIRKLGLQDRRFIALLIFTGMRRGEVLGLRWTDIDFKGMRIHVEQNVTYPHGQNEPHIGSTKTEHGTRTIPLVPELADLLEYSGEEGYVITSKRCSRENPVTLTVVTRMTKRIGSRIDMHGATPHVFRHSFATMANEVGAQMKDIQDLIGDADFNTTANRYVHSREENRVKAAADIAKLLTA